jgi:hypothetical protein
MEAVKFVDTGVVFLSFAIASIVFDKFIADYWKH